MFEARSEMAVLSWDLGILSSFARTAPRDLDMWKATLFSRMSRSARLKTRP